MQRLSGENSLPEIKLEDCAGGRGRQCLPPTDQKQRLSGENSLPEIKLEDYAGGRRRQCLPPTDQKQPKMPTVAAKETKTVVMNAFTAKYKEDSSGWDFHQFISDFDRQHLLQSGQFKAELNQQLESKVSIMKMQHDKAMAEEKRRSEDLAKLLKQAMEEKESWEKTAMELSIIVKAMKHALKQGLQNYVTRLSSSGSEDVIVGEEVASNFRRKSRDEEDREVEPAAKRKKL